MNQIVMINQRITLCLGLFMIAMLAQAQADKNDKLKALFLYKFTEYVTWPQESEKSRIGVVASDAVFSSLQEFQASRPKLEVVRVESPADAAGLHVLFLSKEAAGDYKQYMKPLVGKSTLIVCEDKKDMRWGVDIAFFENNERMSYMVDQSSLERRKLVASGKLLGLGAAR